MKRKHKGYSRPKRPFDKARIESEGKIKENFGLKNKKEIWKAEARIKSIREKAKKLIGSDESKQTALFERLKKQGFKVSSIADVLSLEKEDYLNRRLQTIVVRKGLAPTQRAARQLVTHKKVFVDGKAVGSPSYLVPVALEEKISLKAKKKRTIKKEEPKEEKASADVPSATLKGIPETGTRTSDEASEGKEKLVEEKDE